MDATESAWVLGHRVRRWETDEAYGLIEIVSPPRVPGPPPHFHKSEREFFLILNGRLDVMTDGIWKTMASGSFVELLPGTVHTFVNKSDEDTVWLTGWRPKGFQKFFAEFGIPIDREGARELSVSDEIIRRVVETCEKFGMYVRK
jgi:quercetin dioxygenase-like cupin family protein